MMSVNYGNYQYSHLQPYSRPLPGKTASGNKILRYFSLAVSKKKGPRDLIFLSVDMEQYNLQKRNPYKKQLKPCHNFSVDFNPQSQHCIVLYCYHQSIVQYLRSKHS